jgi:hypothetical protein
MDPQEDLDPEQRLVAGAQRELFANADRPVANAW